MIVLLLVLVALCVLVSFPAWKFQRKRVTWYPWDYGVPAYGIAVWMVLTASGIGAQSLSNLVELLGVSIAACIAPWLRVAFPGGDQKSSLLLSAGSLLLPVITAVLLRLFMPLLPE